MSGSDERPAGTPTDPLERRLLLAFRLIAAGIMLALVVILALVDAFGKPSGFAPSEVFFGSLLGALLALLVVEGAARLVKR